MSDVITVFRVGIDDDNQSFHRAFLWPCRFRKTPYRVRLYPKRINGLIPADVDLLWSTAACAEVLTRNLEKCNVAFPHSPLRCIILGHL
jgi:hypothetical protein